MGSGVGVLRGAVLVGVDWVCVTVVVLGEMVVQPGGRAVPNVDAGALLVALMAALLLLFPLTEADEEADEGVARFEYTTGQYVVAVAIAYVVLLITGDVMMTVAVGAGEAALPLGATRVVDIEPDFVVMLLFFTGVDVDHRFWLASKCLRR